jgi:hypothetical protein
MATDSPRIAAAKMLLAEAQPHDERASLVEMKFAIDYLALFGYIAKKVLDEITVEDVQAAVKKFQGWFGLDKDGIVGPKTIKAMTGPRCGCPDVIDPDNPEHADFERMVDFTQNAENLAKWNKSGISYWIDSYVGGLTKTAQQAIIAGAFKAWDDVCGIGISAAKSPQTADLIISTGQGSRSQFDGPGGTLAWAYLPDGRDRQLLMKFDLGETWIDNPNNRGIAMFNVACHEFGHMLGLEHSKVEAALMAPYYNVNVAVPQWNDDIPRAQARYGKDTANPGTPTIPTIPTVPGGDGYVIRVSKSGVVTVDGYDLFAKPK